MGASYIPVTDNEAARHVPKNIYIGLGARPWTHLNRTMLRTAMKQMMAILYLVSSPENAPTYTPVAMEARTTSKRPPACSQCLHKDERK